MSVERVPARSEVDPRFTWNNASVFPSVEAWAAELAQLSAGLEAVTGWQGRLAEGAPVLADALVAIEAFRQRTAKILVYTGISESVDTGDQASIERAGQARGLFARMLGAIAFLEPELLAIGRETLAAWMAAEPRLAIYAHYVGDLFRRQAHVRSPEVEQLLGLASDAFGGASDSYSKLTDSDFRFEPAMTSEGKELPVTQSTVWDILAQADREARRTAWQAYHDQYLAHKNSLASTLATSIKQNVFLMRARNHPSTLEMSLFQNDVPVEVFHNLIETYRRHLPVWHRYWEVRRRALGVKTIHTFDIWAPLARVQPRVPYEQAVEWISRSLEPLGEQYARAVRRGCLEERWVDVYPNQGKAAGAFSWGTQGTYPFIVMSYTDDVISLGTLAHELGHSMHSRLSWQTQPPVYANYSLFVAEVASNFHQAMMGAYLLEQDLDPNLKIGVIEEAMANFHRYFLVMPTLARFELALHQQVEAGQGLTADGMNALHADLLAEAYGTGMELDRQRDGISWATFGHLYADYYVYQYATGISGANALARRVLSGQPGAAEDYLGFLKAGGSLYPLDALKQAGVDLTRPEPVEETFKILVGLVERLDGLVNQ
jgi:oligoendopeptidase F